MGSRIHLKLPVDPASHDLEASLTAGI